MMWKGADMDYTKYIHQEGEDMDSCLMEAAPKLYLREKLLREGPDPDRVYTMEDIEALPEEYPNVVKTLQDDPKLEEIYSTTGECRIHCVGRSRNKSTMEAHVNYLFNHTKGIRKVSWHILMSDLRKGSVDAESKN
jgi:hypothetical protein